MSLGCRRQLIDVLMWAVLNNALGEHYATRTHLGRAAAAWEAHWVVRVGFCLLPSNGFSRSWPRVPRASIC